MKKWICLLLTPMLWVHAQRKDLSLNDLARITTSSSKEFSNIASKHGFSLPKGFKSSTHLNYVHKQSSKDNISKTLSPLHDEEGSTVLYKTELEHEFNALKEEARAAGFKQIIKDKAPVNETRYQKLEMLLTFRIEREEEKRIYHIEIKRKNLSSATSYVYAEDLLQIESHQMLEAIFGSQNVKTDTVTIDESQSLTCSVLFPNTYSEALIFWNDKVNAQTVEMIVIGEKLNGNYWKSSQQNKWHSRQGIYLGMPIKELLSANKDHFNIYGLKTDYPGFVVPDSPGAINFKKLGIQLSCVDFSDEKEFTSKQTFTTNSLLAKTDRVFVDKMIILQ